MRAEIAFTDDQGGRWKVTRSAGRFAGVVLLHFASDAGEYRTCEVILLDDKTWAELGERACRSLVRAASAAPHA